MELIDLQPDGYFKFLYIESAAIEQAVNKAWVGTGLVEHTNADIQPL
jgi:hypothetical protein